MQIIIIYVRYKNNKCYFCFALVKKYTENISIFKNIKCYYIFSNISLIIFQL